MTTITKAIHVCYALPSSWDAWTADGEYVHLKYRYGVAKVFKAHKGGGGMLWQDSAVQIGEPLDGFIALEDFCTAMGFALDLRTAYVPLEDPNEGMEEE